MEGCKGELQALNGPTLVGISLISGLPDNHRTHVQKNCVIGQNGAIDWVGLLGVGRTTRVSSQSGAHPHEWLGMFTLSGSSQPGKRFSLLHFFPLFFYFFIFLWGVSSQAPTYLSHSQFNLNFSKINSQTLKHQNNYR